MLNLFLRTQHLPFLMPRQSTKKTSWCMLKSRQCLLICPGLPYQEAVELVNIVPIVDFITGLRSK